MRERTAGFLDVMATQAPSYSVGLSDDGSFVHHRSHTSARTPADMADRLKAIIALGNTHQISRLLFDVRAARFESSIGAQYEYAYHQARALGLTRHWRIALLTTPGDRSYDFMETALVNAGYVAGLFHDELRAVEWLKGKGDALPPPAHVPY
jgi:hypothetical protein